MVVAAISISFLLLPNNILLYIYHKLFIHSSIKGYLFPANKLWIVLLCTFTHNYLFEYLFKFLQFFRVYIWNGTAVSYHTFMFMFLQNGQMFFIAAIPFCITTSNVKWFQFLHILSFFIFKIISILVSANFGILLWFDLHFYCLMILSIFSRVCYPFVLSSLEKYLFKSFAHLFELFVFCCWVVRFSIYSIY